MASLNTSLLGGIRRASKAHHDKTINATFCKKHPKHRQSPGVCSLCLNERLFIFIKANSSLRKAREIVYSSSATSLSSSSVSSTCSSPLVDGQRYLLMDGGSSGRGKGSSWMTKSRSVAYKVDDEKRKKKTIGFFFRFGGFKNREQESDHVDN